jgi:prefoldin subunit 5
MVEYTFDEAIALLTKNVENCRANLITIEKDLDFIKDQITTTEVNIARIFNYDVKQRRAARAAGV